VGFNAHQVRHGVCQRGAAHRQGPRTRGPICPEALADNIVKLNLRDLEALFHRVIRALAQAGVWAATVTGLVEATDLETTAPYEGGGQVSRTRKITETRGPVHAIEVTIDGWQRIVVLAARTKSPWAATGVPIQAHETLSLRALITPARTHLAGHGRRHQVVFEKGFWEGVDRWGLDRQGSRCVVPAKENMAVTVDAQAPAAAGEGITVGRRVHTVRQGQGQTAWSERLETEVVGIAGLTTEDQDGPPEHGRPANRRDFQPNPLNAVVVRTWNGRAYGPGGQTVCLTKAPVDRPVPSFDDDDDRRLIENCDIKASQQPWRVQHPPQTTARAGHVHVLFTLRLFALGTADRWPCEPEAAGREAVGWQRWRRQLLEHTRDHVIVLAQDGSGIVQMAEYSLLLGVKLNDRPPGIGTHQDILAQYGLPAPG